MGSFRDHHPPREEKGITLEDMWLPAFFVPIFLGASVVSISIATRSFGVIVA